MLCLYRLGEICFRKGKLETSLTYFDESCEVALKQGMTEGALDAMTRMGSLYLALGNWSRAIELGHMILDLAQKKWQRRWLCCRLWACGTGMSS